jgi:hypothetical protein
MRTGWKHILTLALLAAPGIASAQLSFNHFATMSRTEIFNSIAGLPNLGLGSSVKLGSLDTTQAGTVTFTYLGQESAYSDAFHLTVNGTHLFESNPVGTAISASVTTLGSLAFSFEGDSGRYAYNGPTSGWAPGTSIGLIGQNMTVTSGGGAGTYAFVLGYNDSAGASTLGDWDDFVVGVNFQATPVTAIPEPETYAMLLAGLALLGFAHRKRTTAAA